MALLITDPVGILLTSDGSIDRTAGRSSLARGLVGFRQGVHVRMQMVRGELFYNLEAGRPYVERRGIVPASAALLGQRFDQAKARTAFRQPIIDTPGFGEILTLVIGFEVRTRRLSVSWAARTIWGDTPTDELERFL